MNIVFVFGVPTEQNETKNEHQYCQHILFTTTDPISSPLFFFFQSKKNLLKPFGGMLQSSLSQMRIFDKNPSSFFCARKLIIFLISFPKELLSLKLSLMAFKMS